MFRRKPRKIFVTKKRSIFSGRGDSRQGIELPPNTIRRESAARPHPWAKPQPGLVMPRLKEARAETRAAPIKSNYRSRTRRYTVAASSALLACSIAFTWPAAMGTVSHTLNEIWGIDQFGVKNALSQDLLNDHLPEQLTLPDKPDLTGRLHYSIDPDLQQAVEQQLEKFRPDYGMVVAMDAETGRILAMADIQRDGGSSVNMNLKATYPAASVFKTVTAAAAIDLGKARANTVIPYNGKATSLYKNQVMKHSNNKWTRHDSLEKSFSKSANTVFARLGIYTIGGEALLDYADRFGFNHPVSTDLPLEPSSIEMDPGDDWAVAETASGYTRRTNISPVHGAMMAAAIVNDGRMPMPNLVDYMTDPYGIILFESDQPSHAQVIKPDTAREMRRLMERTVKSGSASRQFRGFSKRHGEIEVGGKTGSLTGLSPRGKYDWFVGYATDGDRKIAYAVLCINKEFWYVKSAHLARELIESYFSSQQSG